MTRSWTICHPTSLASWMRTIMFLVLRFKVHNLSNKTSNKTSFLLILWLRRSRKPSSNRGKSRAISCPNTQARSWCQPWTRKLKKEIPWRIKNNHLCQFSARVMRKPRNWPRMPPWKSTTQENKRPNFRTAKFKPPRKRRGPALSTKISKSRSRIWVKPRKDKALRQTRRYSLSSARGGKDQTPFS